MTRQQLYDEIWKLSVLGVAKKFEVKYSFLYTLCKKRSIPVPPKGYWTKIEHNMPETRIPLPSLDCESELSSVYEAKPSEVTKLVDMGTTELITTVIDTSTKMEKSELKTITNYGQTMNVYDRETLYQEVWKKPVTEVAKKYGVSDVAIHKICKGLDVPNPPNGYWAKVYAGKPVTKIPLPKAGKPAHKTGLRTSNIGAFVPKDENEPLAFLSEEERIVLLTVADQIHLPADGATLHPKIIAYRRQLLSEQKKANEAARRPYMNRESSSKLMLLGAISKESEQRAYRILDAFLRAIEAIGCSISNELKLIIRGETVSFSIYEMKKQVVHIMTREETLALLKYEDAKKRNSWAWKPNIRKYDHLYNGRLCINVSDGWLFRDGKNDSLEDKLGDILVNFYEASEVVRLNRLAQEEAERKKQEEKRLREEYRERYNVEVDCTVALENEAMDYEIACRIRKYVSAVEGKGNIDEQTLHWIRWAKEKADWYDPTIARDDDCFGVRNHKQGADSKALKRSY